MHKELKKHRPCCQRLAAAGKDQTIAQVVPQCSSLGYWADSSHRCQKRSVRLVWYPKPAQGDKGKRRVVAKGPFLARDSFGFKWVARECPFDLSTYWMLTPGGAAYVLLCVACGEPFFGICSLREVHRWLRFSDKPLVVMAVLQPPELHGMQHPKAVGTNSEPSRPQHRQDTLLWSVSVCFGTENEKDVLQEPEPLRPKGSTWGGYLYGWKTGSYIIARNRRHLKK